MARSLSITFSLENGKSYQRSSEQTYQPISVTKTVTRNTRIATRVSNSCDSWLLFRHELLPAIKIGSAGLRPEQYILSQ